uniref:Centrosomal protein of 70 kDa n=1 Tax=Oreochromis aureus TaxID=47969 RepID=A0AAZ1XG08_OREAU
MKQQEQVEWDDVNKRLQHHGFKPVFFADPAENKSPADLVLLDKKSAAELRTTLRMMLTDSERRQALIQELVMSNNQLKMEVQEHMSRAAQQSQAVQQHSHTQQLQKEKLEAHRRCEVLEQKLLKQKEEATQLQRKLHFITKKEEQRLALQRQTSQQRSPADQQGNFLSSSPKQDGTAEISELISDPAKEARLCVYYHHLLNEISAVVADHKAPLRVHKLERSDFQDVLSTLKVWAEQLDLLKGLQCRLKELSVRLMPLQPCDGGYNTDEGAEVGDMMLLVDAMLENASADDKVLRSPTRHTLESMVSHFQKLFDVTSLRGVYPRMNEIYTKLGEMTNAMRNLRDILDLDWCPPLKAWRGSLSCWETLILTGVFLSHISWTTRWQLLRPASIFAPVFQHHHEGETARGILPCFPCPGYRNLTDSRSEPPRRHPASSEGFDRNSTVTWISFLFLVKHLYYKLP